MADQPTDALAPMEGLADWLSSQAAALDSAPWRADSAVAKHVAALHTWAAEVDAACRTSPVQADAREAFEAATRETIPPMGQAGIAQWWFSKGFQDGRASRAQEAPALPQGWRAAPCVPTQEMVAAGGKHTTRVIAEGDYDMRHQVHQAGSDAERTDGSEGLRIMGAGKSSCGCAYVEIDGKRDDYRCAQHAFATSPPLPAAPEQQLHPRLKDTPYGPAILLDDARDAERMDWLERQDLNDIATIRQTNSVVGINVGSGPFYGKTLRAAIDAAIAAAPKEPE